MVEGWGGGLSAASSLAWFNPAVFVSSVYCLIVVNWLLRLRASHMSLEQDEARRG